MATPSDIEAATDACAREPIHIPSSIQPHGLFFALTEADFLLAAVSENAAAQLQKTPQELIGEPIYRFLDDASAERLGTTLRGVLPDAAIILRLRSPARPDDWEASIHRSGELFLVELEPRQANEVGMFLFDQTRNGIFRIRQSANVIAACESLVQGIRAISKYDRVMVYRFDERWNGEVIAEDKTADCRSYLGQSFPASDIPAQARALYTRNSFRVIPDARYTPSRIVPPVDPASGQPIDLSDSILRSVSPVHCEYLANMGVVASMSLSVIKDGALWGLVACHRHTPGYVSSNARRGCEAMIEDMVAYLDTHERVSSSRAIELIRKHEASVLTGSPGDREFGAVLESLASGLLSEAGAQGLALCLPVDIWTAGNAPPALQIREIANWLSAGDSPTLFTDCLADLLPAACDGAEEAGMAAVKLPIGWLLWFRPEWRHSVSWAGEPTKSASVSAETGRINPRTSFETWLQNVQGRSRPWDAGERATAIEAGGLFTRLMIEDQQARRLELELQNNRLLSERAKALESLSKELRSAKEAAEEASVAKGQFLANMSHEIRTPMNAVLGFANILKSLALGAAERDMVQKIHNAGRSLLSIINNILDFSKIEAGGLEIEQAPFRLGDVLNNVAAIMGSAAGKKDLELIVGAMPDGAEFLIGDAMRLEQVLVNLVGNSIKFTETGEVVLTVGQNEVEPGQKKLCFAVRDTGMGIAPEKQKEVFSAFSQADGSTARRFGGTGLGLTITHRLVNLMGGDLGLISSPGEGSEFSFSIPLTPDPQIDLATPCFPPGQRMLIADDHPVALEILAEIARGMGWSVRTASSGKDAVAQAIAATKAGIPFEALLLDWTMPGMDGPAAANRLKAELGERQPPVILMLKAQDREQLMRHPQSGVADAVLVKPVTASAMFEAVGQAIRKRSGQEEVTGSPNQLRLADLCIMVVDDSDINREVACQILEREGAEVMHAADGVQALDQLRTTPRRVDIVLMDVQMPVMDGYQATRHIREDLFLVDLPVVALTAGVFKSQQQAALDAGMNGFVPKPFDVNELIGAVLRFTGRQPAAIIPTRKSAVAPLLIDREAALRNWGDAASYHKYLCLFATTHGRDGEDIARLLADDRPQDVIALAHKLKGVAGSLSLTRVWRHAAALEQTLAHKKSAGGWEMDLRELQAALHSTLAAIADCIDSGENAAEARPAKASLDATSDPRLFDDLLRALDRDNLGEAETILDGLANKLAPDLLAALREMLGGFDLRGAEALALAARVAIPKEAQQ